MECPFCNSGTRVLESRLVNDSVRRRRHCSSCTNRFTTYEQAVFHLTVIKKDGRIQPFDVQKIRESLVKACNKIDTEIIDSATRKIERKLLSKKRPQLSSREIGRLALMELKKIDKMAYVRFASIHKGIEDPKLLRKEVSMLT